MASNQFYELLNRGTIEGLEPDAIVGTQLTISGNSTVGGTLGVTGAITASGGVLGALTGAWNVPVAAVAAAGSGQSDGGALSAGLNVVSAADATKAVVLPAAAAGKIVMIYNLVGNKSLPVFPASGDKINGGTADASVTCAAGTPSLFVAKDATDWYSIVFTSA